VLDEVLSTIAITLGAAQQETPPKFVWSVPPTFDPTVRNRGIKRRVQDGDRTADRFRDDHDNNVSAYKSDRMHYNDTSKR